MTQNFSLLGGANKPTSFPAVSKTNPLLNFLPSFSTTKFQTSGTFTNTTTPSFVSSSQPGEVPKPDLQMQAMTRWNGQCSVQWFRPLLWCSLCSPKNFTSLWVLLLLHSPDPIQWTAPVPKPVVRVKSHVWRERIIPVELILCELLPLVVRTCICEAVSRW